MRLIATTQAEIQPRLFEFLTSVLQRQPRASGPILADGRALRQLYAQADSQLVTVLQHCLERLLLEVSPAPAARLLANAAPLQFSSSILGLAIAAHNALSPFAPRKSARSRSERRQSDPVESFTKALIATLPDAQSVPEMLLYHSVLRDVTPPPESWPVEMPALVASLVAKSPLTSLVALDGYRNPALQPLADEPLKASSPAKRPRKNRLSSWHKAVELLCQQPELVAWLRRQWLDLPETRHSCRHLGLILEMLRRQGTRRALVLEFYEAYERCHWRGVRSYARPSVERDPSAHALASVASGSVFDEMEELLRATGSSDAALRLNRWGNEYLLKFLPVVEIVITEKGVPKDYRHLTSDLVDAIRRLLQYSTSNVQHRIEFTPVDFDDEPSDDEQANDDEEVGDEPS